MPESTSIADAFRIILDVYITCYKALDLQNAEQDESVTKVLRRYGSDKLHERLEAMTNITEELGGHTSLRTSLQSPLWF